MILSASLAGTGGSPAPMCVQGFGANTVSVGAATMSASFSSVPDSEDWLVSVCNGSVLALSMSGMFCREAPEAMDPCSPVM